MGKTAKGSDRASDYDILDWEQVKAEILSRIDVCGEYEKLGIKFFAPEADNRGWRKCHAIGREQQTPSADVHVKTGKYNDFSNGEKSLTFFNFALKHGHFDRFIDVINHYASVAGVPLGKPRTASEGRIRDGHFDYLNPDGTVRYRVFRYIQNYNFKSRKAGDKTFTQHPPDGKGGWKFGPKPMEGIDPVPYRLPDLLASDPETQTCWIVEGERKADRLTALGLIATTSHGGCGHTSHTWPKFDPTWFRGRHCVLLPDNSPDGRRHMEGVAAWLLTAGAGSVKVVNLPDLTRDADIIDWFDQGGTIDGLHRLAHEAPDWEPKPEPEKPESPTGFRSATVADVRRLISETRYLWDRWIPASRPVGVAGMEGTGKTRFAMDLFRRAYKGLPWPDGSEMTIPPGIPSIWVCADSHQDELADMLPEFGLPDDAVHFATTPDDPYGGTDIDNPETFELIESTIEELGRIYFIFVDTLTTATSKDLSDQRSMKPLKAMIMDVCQKHHISFFLLLHMNRQGQALGLRIKGITRTLMHLECPDPEKPERLTLWVEKTSGRRPAGDLGVMMGDGGNEYDDKPSPRIDRTGRRGGQDVPPDPASQRCRDFVRGTLTARQRAAVKDLLDEWIESGGKESTWWRVYKEMQSSGEMVVDDGRPKMANLTGNIPQGNGAF